MKVRHRHRCLLRSLIIPVFCSFVSVAATFRVASHRFRLPRPELHHASVGSFDWANLKASEDLQYQDCYDGFQCARLLVPLDWESPASPSISLALIRLPATVDPTDPAHGGSLILNPGGPGGSGVSLVLQAARGIQQHLSGERQYEILSFDPRGVWLSEPRLDCFRTFADEVFWDLQQTVAGVIQSGNPQTFAFHWAGAQALADLCVSENTDARQYVSAMSVAQDLLRITEKVDEEKRRAAIFSGKQVQQTPLQDPDNGSSKLQYLGWSYGTYIGQVFASMFPERVGRMVLDSVLDAEDWTLTPTFSNLNDSNKALDYFYDICFRKGTACPLWRAEDTSSLDINMRVAGLLQELNMRPIPSIANGTASIITGDTVRALLWTSLYSPMLEFPLVAQFIQDILTNRPLTLEPMPLCPSCSGDPDMVPGLDRFVSIACTDGPDLTSQSLSDFEQYFQHLARQSDFAYLWGRVKIACWKWPVRPNSRFTGPFGSAVPILFLNNRLDPVTPVGNARKASALFEGSVFLEHNATGHAALLPGSRCMWEHARLYLEQGYLPAHGTICESDCEPFNATCSGEPGLYALHL